MVSPGGLRDNQSLPSLPGRQLSRNERVLAIGTNVLCLNGNFLFTGNAKEGLEKSDPECTFERGGGGDGGQKLLGSAHIDRALYAEVY